MILPFLDRDEELKRLKKAFSSTAASFSVIYGRRRCGKSRLLQKALEGKAPAVYYVGDDRDAPIQIESLAGEIARLLPGFDSVRYPGWAPLLDRWAEQAPAGAALALDEFPYLVGASPELPGILQKFIDGQKGKALHLAVCGSSQRMMHHLVLNAGAPLYGRAREILKIDPLPIYYLSALKRHKNPKQLVEFYSVFGGVPRYWELALESSNLKGAIIDHVLNHLGVLFHEPERLLSDEMRDTRQAASILTLIGRGCARISEVASRINKPVTSLTRPVAMLLELGFIERQIPFGASEVNSKKSLYAISDPFLQFWYTYVDPNQSILEASRTKDAYQYIMKSWPSFAGQFWEKLARKNVPLLNTGGEMWGPASRWWGRGEGNREMEIDILASSLKTKNRVLAGGVKFSLPPSQYEKELKALKEKTRLCPALKGKSIIHKLWILSAENEKHPDIITGADVIESTKK